MLPVKARSEFLSRASPGVVSLMNDADGRVLDTSVMFQRASPASNQPAFSPTRGSGLGGAADMRDALGTFPVPAAGIGMVSLDGDGAHAAADSTPAASESGTRRAVGRGPRRRGDGS